MSRKVKEMVCQELSEALAGVDSCFVVDPTSLDGVTANRFRRSLAEVNARMLVVKNSLARLALEGKPLASAGELLDGPCAIAFGGESIVDLAKLLTAKVKEMPALQIKGAVMEGQVLKGPAAEGLAKLPSKAEMRSILVGTALSPGSKLAGAILGAGSMVANLLKGRIEALDKQEGAAAA